MCVFFLNFQLKVKPYSFEASAFSSKALDGRAACSTVASEIRNSSRFLRALSESSKADDFVLCMYSLYELVF